jgi:hypothetical protein
MRVFLAMRVVLDIRDGWAIWFDPEKMLIYACLVTPVRNTKHNFAAASRCLLAKALIGKKLITPRQNPWAETPSDFGARFYRAARTLPEAFFLPLSKRPTKNLVILIYTCNTMKHNQW